MTAVFTMKSSLSTSLQVNGNEQHNEKYFNNKTRNWAETKGKKNIITLQTKQSYITK